MLIRSSRLAGQLTKEALLHGLGRAAWKIGKGTLGTIGRNPGTSLGVGMVGLTAAPAISEGLKKSRMGLHPQYLQAANAGMVPSIPQ